jgi:predicted DNA-binding transcriptional regulator YafY
VLRRVLAIAEDLQARRAKVDGGALAARLSDSERAAWADIARLLGLGTPGPAVAVQVNNHQAAAGSSPAADLAALLAPLASWRRAYPEAHEALMEALAKEAHRAGA